MGKAQRRRAMKKINKQLDALIPGHAEFKETAEGFLKGKISGSEAMQRFAPFIQMIARGDLSLMRGDSDK